MAARGGGREQLRVWRSRFRSLGTKLLLSHFLVMLLSVVLAGGASYFLLTKQLLFAKQEEMLAQARFAAAQIDEKVRSQEAVLQRIAAGHEVREFADTYRDLALAAYLAKFRDVFPSLSYVNSDGETEVRVVEGEISGTVDHGAGRECFLRAKVSPHTVRITPLLHSSPPEGTPMIRFSYGLHRYFGNEFVGVIIGSVPFSFLTRNLASQNLGHYDLKVVGADGSILYAQGKAESGQTRIKLRDLQGHVLEPSDLHGPAGGERVLLGDSQVLIAHAPVDSLGVSVVFTIPYAIFMATPRQLGGILSFLLFCLGLAAAPPLAFIIAKNLSRPLISLTKAVERLSRGDLRPIRGIDTASDDEVGNLVKAYNNLAQDLWNTTISRDYLENILASMNESVVVLDEKEKIRLVNLSTVHLLGYSEQELLGQPMSLIFPSYKSRDLAEGSARTSADGQREIECVYRSKAGEELPVLFTRSLLRSHSGKQEEAVCVALDIRKRKQDEAERDRLQQQLHQAQKMETIGTLAGGIAHDFNNLLTAILGYTNLAMEGAGHDQELRENLEQVNIAGHRATELVRQILAFSRQTKQERGPVPLQTLVKETLKLLRSSIPASIEIVQQLNAADLAILADPAQIQQMVMNLCSNAAQALEASGGKLEVRLDLAERTGTEAHLAGLEPAPEPYVQLIVADNGPGMDEATLARIFDPFFTTKEVGKGTGMGLAVVHGIVKAHQGQIEVQSSPGRGATFAIYLPALNSPQPLAIPVQEPLPPGQQEHILVIDDEEAISSFLTKMLTGIGYHVTAYSDGEKALAAFRAEPYRFDLVLTDQAMPGCQGALLAGEMLRLRPNLPIILCTGYSSVVDQEKCRGIGIRDFLLKPLDRVKLATVLRHALDRKSSGMTEGAHSAR